MAIQPKIFILSTDKPEIENLDFILSESRFASKAFEQLEELKTALARSNCRVAILDVDSVPLTNRTIRLLKDSHPEVTLFCISLSRLHPELQDALSHDICACLNKPVDPEELRFWLKAIRTSALDSKALT